MTVCNIISWCCFFWNAGFKKSRQPNYAVYVWNGNLMNVLLWRRTNNCVKLTQQHCCSAQRLVCLLETLGCLSKPNDSNPFALFKRHIRFRASLHYHHHQFNYSLNQNWAIKHPKGISHITGSRVYTEWCGKKQNTLWVEDLQAEKPCWLKKIRGERPNWSEELSKHSLQPWRADKRLRMHNLQLDGLQ